MHAIDVRLDRVGIYVRINTHLHVLYDRHREKMPRPSGTIARLTLE